MSPISVKYLPQVIVKFRDNVNLPWEDDIGADIQGRGIGPWDQLESRFPGIRIQKLYRHVSAGQLATLVDRAVATDAKYRRRNLLTYFVVKCPPAVDARAVADSLAGWSSIESAYPDRTPVLSTPPCTTNYETPAAAGIDAQFAWTIPGGDGQGQSLIDLEQGWTLNHVAIAARAIPPPIIGVNDPAECSHGTSVLGIICGSGGGFPGIVPNVQSVAVASGQPVGGDPVSMATIAEAMVAATMQLPFGGVLVIEYQSPDFLPCETDPVCFQHINVATAAGVVVVESAGNGANDLDAVVDSSGAPILLRNGSNAAFQDSGAVMVAAASAAAPHQWRINSNFGSRIDCYAWGDGVLAPISSGPGDTTPTGCFFDTSAATAIIAGVALSVQGMHEAHSGQRLSPAQMQAVLSDPATGTVAVGQNANAIGVMPDLRAIALKTQSVRRKMSPPAPTNLHILG